MVGDMEVEVLPNKLNLVVLEAVVPVEIIVSQSVLRMGRMVISKREHLLLLLKHLKVMLVDLVDLTEMRMVDKVVAVAALVVLAMVLLVQELVVMVVLEKLLLGCLVHLGQLDHLLDVGLLAVVVVLLDRIVVAPGQILTELVGVPVVVEEAIVIH
jgi:hypothetical protein